MSDHPLSLIIYAAVKPIWKIYFIIGLGFFLAKRNILSVTTCRDISDTIVTAIMPCLIFNNIVTNLKSSDIKNLGIIFFSGTVLFAAGASLAYLTFIVTKAPRKWIGGLLSVGLFPNISDLPIAYLQTLSVGNVVFTTEQGNLGVAYVCIFLASQVLYQFCFGGYRLIEWDFRDDLKGNDDESIDTEPKDSTTGSQVSPVVHQPRQQPHPTVAVDDDQDTSSISSSVTGGLKPLTPDEDKQHNEFLTAHDLHQSASNAAHSTTSSEQRAGRSRRASISSDYYSLHLSTSRAVELRQQKSQDIRDVINEYSEFNNLKNTELRRSHSGTSEHLATAVTPEQDSSSVITKKFNYGAFFKQFFKNFLAPNSVSLIVSIAIAMSPPLKALFVKSAVHIHPAPDGQPPLSFIMDIVSYIGAASVPLGLILLGATISRLQIKKMPEGFWKTAIMITVCRLILLPIIGVGITTGMHNAGWYGDDPLIRFVSVLEFGLPSATALVYFTAFYTDPLAEDHLQMDCLAVCLIAQYSILFITLPFLVTFTFKVSLGY